MHRCQLSPNFAIGDGPQNDSSVPKSPKGTDLSPNADSEKGFSIVRKCSTTFMYFSENLAYYAPIVLTLKPKLQYFLLIFLLTMTPFYYVIMGVVNGCGQGVPKAYSL